MCNNRHIHRLGMIHTDQYIHSIPWLIVCVCVREKRGVTELRISKLLKKKQKNRKMDQKSKD